MIGEYLVEGRTGWSARSPETERRRRKLLTALVITVSALALSGCASAPKPAYHEVKVATPVSCVPKDAATGPEGAEAPDALASEPDGPTRYARLAAAYLALRAWSLTAAPILEGCRAAAKPQ